MTKAVFAIPGDKDQRTGGSIYDATVLRKLNELGHETAYLRLPGSFPDPSIKHMRETFDALSAVPETSPIIIDGLALGAMDPKRMDSISAPVVGMLHHPLGLETGLSRERASYLLRNEAEVLRHVAHVVVPSKYIAGVIGRTLNIASDRISVATPGFDRPKAAACKAVAKSEPPLILSVGILSRRKGHDVLLKALALLSDLDWQVEIIGKAHDPKEAAELKATTTVNSLVDRVRFVGEVTDEALQQSYRRASVFALATRYEGYGMVLSEAMMHGLPVVSCKVGAVPETVDEAGILVPPDDPYAFASALRSLLESPQAVDRYASAAKVKAATLPSWNATARVFLEVLERVAT